jgi:acetyltransferase-like isoleucine patch superfamily enzyme
VRLRSLPEVLAALVGELRRLTGERRLASRLLRQYEGLHLGPWVEIRSPERLRLGKRVVIDNGAVLHCGGMEWSHGRGGISIGDDTYVGPKAVLFGAGGIDIGSHVLISPGVLITSHQHRFVTADEPMSSQPAEFDSVFIEDNVWIGGNATILPGVKIGSGSVIGAGAVVAKSVPRRTLAVGVPAKIIRQL